MFHWKYYNDYRIIEDISLKNTARENNIKLLYSKDIYKETRDWFNFARIISRKNGFNIIYETCFIYYITMYFADEGISAGAEEEYFIRKLDKKIEELYSESKSSSIDEVSQKIHFFNSLLKLFKSSEIKEYERHLFQHNIRVSSEIKEWFMKRGSVHETVRKLLEGTVEKPHLNMNTEHTDNLVFLLTYTEETQWRKLSKVDDPDRLRVLLY